MQRPDYSKWPDLEEILRRYREVVGGGQQAAGGQAPAPVATTPAAEPVELRRRVKAPGCTRPHVALGGIIGVQDLESGRPGVEGRLESVEWLPDRGWRLWVRVPAEGPGAILVGYDADPQGRCWRAPMQRPVRLWLEVDPTHPGPPEEAKTA